jgi:hypothetical protein
LGVLELGFQQWSDHNFHWNNRQVVGQAPPTESIEDLMKTGLNSFAAKELNGRKKNDLPTSF